LFSFVLKHVKNISENSILVVTSKIVALAEGRTVPNFGPKERERLILQESDWARKTNLVWLTRKDGMIMANAGVDESNANGQLILLPRNSFKSAELLREKLVKHLKIKNLGVIISDSALMPLRSGVVGGALGYAGFKGVRSYVGERDIFKRKLEFSKTNIADSLATAAVLCMGEGREQKPLALITNAPVVFQNKINQKELNINPAQDIYAPLFNKLN